MRGIKLIVKLLVVIMVFIILLIPRILVMILSLTEGILRVVRLTITYLIDTTKKEIHG